jgi:periplasmic divalent cation tolerance protein
MARRRNGDRLRPRGGGGEARRCANLLAPMQSIYRWEGQLQSATETPMLLKTTRAIAERLRVFVAEYHPYDTPCVVGFQTLPIACNLEYVA